MDEIDESLIFFSLMVPIVFASKFDPILLPCILAAPFIPRDARNVITFVLFIIRRLPPWFWLVGDKIVI